MRMRNVLLTSAASAGLFLAATSLPSAYAQKGTFLSPASQWAVTKVDGKGTSTQPEYCAVAKRYGGNAIMTIARNQSSETSFALDLQKTAFDQSRKLKVALDPGAGEQREFSVDPVSAQAFVVKLGRDKVFFDAIERTGLLRVEAGEQFYVFNVADIGVGETKLTSCLASSAPPVTAAVSSSYSPVPFPTRVDSNSNQMFVDELNSRIESLETQNTSLKREISKVEEVGLSAAQAPAAATSPEASKLRAENLRLKAALQTGAIAEQSEKMRMLEADNKRLAVEANSQSGLSGRVTNLQDQLEGLLDDNSALTAKVSNSVGFDVSSYEADIRQLKLENKSLRRALSEQAEQGDVSGDVQAQLQELEFENRSLKERSLLNEQAARQEKMVEVQQVRDGYRDQVAALEVEVRALNARRASYKADAGEVDELQSQLLVLRSENVGLQEQLIDKKEALTLASLDGDQVDALEVRNEKLKTAVQKSLNAHNLQGRALKALETENAALKGRIDDAVVAVSVVDDLKFKLESAQARLDLDTKKREHQEQKLAALSSENNGLKEQLQLSAVDGEALVVAQNDISLLQQEVAAKDSALKQVKRMTQTSIASLEEKLTSQEGILSKLDDDSQSNISALEELVALKDTLLEKLGVEKETEIASLQEQLEARDVKVAALSEESQSDVDALKQQLVSANEALEGIGQESEISIAVLKEELTTKDALIEKLGDETQTKIAALETELSAKDEALALMQEETQVDLASLQENLADKDAKLQKYNAVPERLNKLLAAYKQSKEEKTKLEAVLLASADENTKTVAEKSAANAALEQQLAEANTRNKAFGEKLEGLQKSVIAMAELNNEAKGLHLALADKQKEIDSLTVLQQDLQVAQADNKDLKDEKDKLVLALQEALNMSEQKIASLEDVRAEDAEMIATLELQKDALKDRNESVLAENSNLKGETDKLVDSYEEMMAENSQLNEQQVETSVSKNGVKAENETLRVKLASVLDMFKKQEEALKGKDEAFTQVLAQNEALRGQLDLASEVIASADIAKLEQPVHKVSTISETTQGSVILAAAEIPTPDSTPRRKAHKPKPAPEELSIAEQLNAMTPAAGDEESMLVAQAEIIEAPDVIEEAQDFMERDLNQAQIYEEQLKRSLDNEQVIQKSQAAPIDIEELASDPVTAVIERVAAPDKDIVAEPVAKKEQEPVTQVEISKAAMPEVKEEAKAVAEKTVEVTMSQDPFEGIKSAEKDEKPADVKEAVVEQTVVDKEKPPLPFKVKEPKSQPVNVTNANDGSVARVLKTANVEGLSSVKKINKAGDAYQWRAGSLYGSGEQRKMTSPAQFDEFVAEYLTRTEERCSGDFAIMPDNSTDSGSMRVDSYEVACVGNGINSSASLVFYNDGDVFTVLAHETKTEDMDKAMLARDKVFDSLTNGRDS